MKNRKTCCCVVGSILLFMLLALFMVCSPKNPLDELEITLDMDVEKALWSNTYTANPSTAVAISNFHVEANAQSLGKAAFMDPVTDQHKVEMGENWENVYETWIAPAGDPLINDLIGGTFKNFNLADCTVDFYLGLNMDPLDVTQTDQVIKIGRAVIPTGEHTLPPFTQEASQAAVVEWYNNNIDLPNRAESKLLEKCFLYFIFTGDPNINIDIVSMSWKLPAEVREEKRVDEGDLTEWAVLSVFSCFLKGTVTNTGTQGIAFWVKMTDSNATSKAASAQRNFVTVGEGFVHPPGHPNGNVFNLETETDFLMPGMQEILKQTFVNLTLDDNDPNRIDWIDFILEVKSAAPMSFRVDDLRLFARLRGTAE